MSFAISRGNHIIDCNGYVINSSIEKSSIDMNGEVITSHGTPVNGTDVVNKDYINNLISFEIVTLTGIDFTTILSHTEGDIFISVKNIIPNGPSGSFQLSKSEPSRYSSYTRMSSSAGITTNERLDIRWNPNTGIELKKTGIGYDGEYRIKYIFN